MESPFIDCLVRSGTGIVSLTGGGGKTSLLFAMSRELARRGARTVCTTTTRMRRPVPADDVSVLLTERPADMLAPADGALYVARPARPGDDQTKVRGLTPEDVDTLAATDTADWIIVEADGAAGRPLKAPAIHEPVIPSRTRVVVSVLGLGCMGKPFGPDVAFRLDEIAAITGLRPDEPITPRAVASLAAHENGFFKNAPAEAVRILFCNQADYPGAAAAGAELASLLPDWLDGVFIGSLATKGLECQAMR